MRETTLDNKESGANVADALWRAAAEQRSRPALAHRQGDSFQVVTIDDVAGRVERLAAGLIGAGLQPGDRICLFSPTRIEYTYVDLAVWTAGCVAVTIYETSSAEQVEWIVSDSGAKAVVIDGDDRRKVFAERAGELGSCGLVFDFDDLAALERLGKDVSAEQVRIRRRARGAGDLATLVYTSGTTGKPKGVELTHANLRWTLDSTIPHMKELFNAEGSTLMFLPLAHIFARLVQLAAIETGVVINYSTGIPNLVEELEMTRPTFVFAAPRVFDKLYTRARQTAHADGKGKIFDLAADVAIRYSRQLDTGRPALGTRILHRLFEPLVYRKLRGVFGGRVRHAISGSAPLGARLGHFYRGIGLQVLEGYGLTETAAGGAVNLPGALKIGTVGRPSPGSEIRIAEDGEIVMRGGHVMRGYWHNPEATREVLDPDGWLHTGDIGHLDNDGYLSITGRKKEIIITAGGKNVAPAPLEDRLRAHPLISECMVIGDARPFVSVLVSIDGEEWARWAAENGQSGPVSEHVDDPALLAEIGRAVEEANQAVSKAESIREFRIVPGEFTVEGGELTTTLKLRRNIVADKYADLIESIYEHRHR